MRLSSLQGMRVVDEAGESLGRLFDFRCRGAPVDGRARDSAEATTLVYGSVGLLERLGIRTANECEARWEDVIALTGDRIIVRAEATRRRRRA